GQHVLHCPQWSHVQGNDARDTQYASGGTLTSSGSTGPTVAAATLERSCSTVAAPLSTTSAHGWARTAAMATASTVVPAAVAAFRTAAGGSPRSVSRPLASASLTMTP